MKIELWYKVFEKLCIESKQIFKNCKFFLSNSLMFLQLLLFEIFYIYFLNKFY